MFPPSHIWLGDERLCDILCRGNIYLRRKSFDCEPQEEHVGSLCVAQRQTAFDSFPDWSTDAGPGWSHPSGVLRNACLLLVTQLLSLFSRVLGRKKSPSEAINWLTKSVEQAKPLNSRRDVSFPDVLIMVPSTLTTSVF